MACAFRVLIVSGLIFGVAGCSNYERPHRPAWRDQANAVCLAENKVSYSRYLQPRGSEVEGSGICGLAKPLLVGALDGDRVQLDRVATLDCPMVAALDRWITEVVQPAARVRFGQPVAQIDTMGSYSCRGMNGQIGAQISEHAFGNAIDIGGFRLVDGRKITVVQDWTRGDEQTQAFLRDVHAGACSQFTTVLGPGANVFHYNHIHIDLAMHGNTSTGPRRICKPLPHQSAPTPRLDNLPDPPMIEEEQDIASAGPPDPPRTLHPGPGGLVASTPPLYPAPQASASNYSAIQAYPPKSPDSGHATSGYPVPGSLYPGAAHATPSGSIREDGAFVPEGGPRDWDRTSSIPQR